MRKIGQQAGYHYIPALIVFWLAVVSSCGATTNCTGAVACSPTPTPTLTSTPTPPMLVQHPSVHNVDENSHSNTVSFASSVKPGNLIIVAVSQYHSMLLSVEDDQNDHFNAVLPAQSDKVSDDVADDYVELYYAKSVTGGQTTITVKFSSNNDSNVGIYEFSGLNTASPLDRTTSNKGLNNAPDGGVLTSDRDNELFFAVGVDDDGADAAPTPGSGYTLLDVQTDDLNERFYSEYGILQHGNHQTDFSISVTSYWAVIGASFQS